MLTRRTPSADRHSLPEPLRPPAAAVAGRAVFSACGRYRWWLERLWWPEAPRLLFIGLNPSCADAQRDDPTLRRLIGFARGWGFGGLEVLNLFACVATSPALLRRWPDDPVGRRNDAWIRRRLAALRPGATPLPSATAPVVWLGWGNQGRWRHRNGAVLQLLQAERVVPVCLGPTAAGQPRHPLYCPATLQLVPYGPSFGCRSASTAAPWPVPRVATPSTCS